MMNNFVCNLNAGARLALFLPVERERFRANAHQIFVFAAIGPLMYLAVDYLATLSPVRFNRNGLPFYAASLVAFFVGCYAVSVVAGATRRYAEFIIMVLAASPLAYAVNAGLRFYATGHESDPASILHWSGWALLGWGLLIVSRSVRLVCDSGVLRRLAAVSVYAGCSLAPLYAFVQVPVWYTERSAASAPPQPYLNVESTYYRQPKLIARAIDAIASQRPGVVDLYSIGFAGYGHQDVFMKEVLAAQEILDRRFDTRDRSISLINNHATLRTVPLANMHNLRTALSGIAAKMDVEEDVLFLFLTSHGSRNHYLATNMGPLRHDAISGRELRRSLDVAGIRWRVVVVSACFSGGFIDALEGDGTMVITAARRDRQSFGCGVGREWTYFGEAFFAEALATGRPSFIEAYQAATAAVATREADEGLTPSEPKLNVGRGIVDRLRRLEERLSVEVNFDVSSTSAF